MPQNNSYPFGYNAADPTRPYDPDFGMAPVQPLYVPEIPSIHVNLNQGAGRRRNGGVKRQAQPGGSVLPLSTPRASGTGLTMWTSPPGTRTSARVEVYVLNVDGGNGYD